MALCRVLSLALMAALSLCAVAEEGRSTPEQSAEAQKALQEPGLAEEGVSDVDVSVASGDDEPQVLRLSAAGVSSAGFDKAEVLKLIELSQSGPRSGSEGGNHLDASAEAVLTASGQSLSSAGSNSGGEGGDVFGASAGAILTAEGQSEPLSGAADSAGFWGLLSGDAQDSRQGCTFDGGCSRNLRGSLPEQ